MKKRWSVKNEHRPNPDNGQSLSMFGCMYNNLGQQKSCVYQWNCLQYEQSKDRPKLFILHNQAIKQTQNCIIME